MKFKPKDWFLGPGELFGVLVPGAVVLFVIRWIVVSEGIVTSSWPDTILDWAAFIIASFIIGYLAHPPAHILNKLYDRTYCSWKRRNGDPLLRWAEKEAQGEAGPDDSIYAWANSEVAANSSKIAARIVLIEGVSKMFRALTLLLLIAALFAAVFGRITFVFGFIFAALLSFFVFSERRYAATKEIYQRLKRIRGDEGAK